VAILAPLLAYAGRFFGKLLQMAFGWATILLFGRVPQSKQLLLSGIALASLAWAAVATGVLFPGFGTLLLTAVPAPDWIREEWIRLGMLIAAVVLPVLIGIGGLFLLEPKDRPAGRQRLVQVLRGYPYALVLAVVIGFLVVVAPLRRVRTLVKRWEDAHIPVVVKPDGYERVADDLEAALDGARLPIERTKAPILLETPSKLLAAVGGASVRRLVPQRLLVLKNRQLEVTIYPSDVAMAGTREQVARSRAAIASTLTFTAAYQTTTKEAQEIEDRLEVLAKTAGPLPWRAFDEIDERLAQLVVPFDDWQVLYRIRLQVERDLRQPVVRGRDEGDGFRPLRVIGELIRRLVR
jgi:hypothetical protein